MIVKYINSDTNWVCLSEFSSVYMKKKSNEDNDKEFVLCFQDNYGKILNVYSPDSETCLDYLDKLYNTGSVDVSCNPEICVIEDYIHSEFTSLMDLGFLGTDSDDEDGEDIGPLFFGFV